MIVRRVRLRVRNVPWLADYHGREAGLVGEVVDAVELDQGASGGVVGYVDDRDGEASEYAEALDHLRAPTGELIHCTMTSRTLRELRDHAARRMLHGDVVGVRA